MPNFNFTQISPLTNAPEWLNVDSTWNDTGAILPDGTVTESPYLLKTDDEFRTIDAYGGVHYNWLVYG